MTLKEALYREIRFGLCGAGGALEGLVSPDHVKLDVRIAPDSAREDSDYPWLIFRVSRQPELDRLRLASASVEVAVIGRRTSATKGDAMLERVRGLLIDALAGTRKTRGKFDADGYPDPSGGLLMSAVYQDTVEAMDERLEEKVYVLTFTFAYVRP